MPESIKQAIGDKCPNIAFVHVGFEQDGLYSRVNARQLVDYFQISAVFHHDKDGVMFIRIQALACPK